MKPHNIALYGVGAFGYALLNHLDNKYDGSFNVQCYDHDQSVVTRMIKHNSHPYFYPDVTLDHEVTFGQPEEILKSADTVIVAVSSDASREVARIIREHAPEGITILNLAKALDKDSGKRLSEVYAEEMHGFEYHYALLAGGTIAEDLFHHDPLGITIASMNQDRASQISKLLHADNLHIYPSTDLAGTEYASALKNVISILAGIVSGLGFSYGAETHIISKTAQEVGDVCIHSLGADPHTFSIGSQAWGNDMWMSCTGNTRNRQLGILLGQGMPPAEALAKMKQERKLAEGVNTLQVIDKINGLQDVPAISLLRDLIVTQSVAVDAIKQELLTADYPA